jgi:hypothetical protein
VKDLLTGVVRAQGESKGGVYEWSGFNTTSSSPTAFSISKIAPINWHFRLGHPSLPILNVIISKNELNICSRQNNFPAMHVNVTKVTNFHFQFLL